MDAERLAASPDDPDAVAVSMKLRELSPRHGGVALLRAGDIQPRITQNFLGSNLIVFDPGGAYLYGYASEFRDTVIRRINVLADGLIESELIDIQLRPSSDLAWSSRGLIFSDTLYRTSDFLRVGTANVGTGNCRQLTDTDQWICLDHNRDTARF
ncbi:MAG: hypothetical protein WBD51_10120, partial [Burkholderiaceae bacterium]